MFHDFVKLTFDYAGTILPTFIVAILISAILSKSLPDTFFEKALGSNKIIAIFLASITGALLPLCACGTIPLACRCQQKGASWKTTIAFLTSGSSSSISVLILTLTLGLKITLLRFLISVICGVVVAFIFTYFLKEKEISGEACALSQKKESIVQDFLGLLFSFGPWVITAILLAGVITLFLDPNGVTKIAGAKNIFSPFLLATIGFPFYFCGGSDIPIAKALLDKGASLGSVLAFMASAPGVNLTSFIISQKWLGFRNAVIYLLISVLTCGLLGLIVNMILL